MPHPKFKFLTPHTPEWRELRRSESQRLRRVIRDWNGDERLAPGRPPDPDRERCLCNVSTLLTERELAALKKHKPARCTNSTFVRHILCQYLENLRRKDCPSMPFGVDLNNLESRQLIPAPSAAKRRRGR